IDPRRLTKEQLLLELTKRKINVDKTAKRDELIKELELALINNIEIIQEENFLEGDVDKSKRYTTAIILESLKRKVEEGELGEDEVPKLQTIHGWISRYSA
ncbi:11812_t:CDS:2, partial [Funneliformis caledonium]